MDQRVKLFEVLQLAVGAKELDKIGAAHVLLPLAIKEFGAHVGDKGARMRAERVEANILAATAQRVLLPQPLV